MSAKALITRRRLQIALGLLWLLDGVLQLQHQMFTSSFANNVLAPAAQGQPRVVSGPMNFGIHVILTHPAVFDALFVLIQLALGILILWKRTIRQGLMASAVWALAVWYMGEGLGGLLGLHTLLLMGAPGAALLYAILALAVLPPPGSQENRGSRPAGWLASVWAVLWLGGAVYQLLPGQNTTSDLSGMIAGNAGGAPSWLASLDSHTANIIHGIGGSVQNQTAVQMHMTTVQMAAMPAPTSQSSGLWFIVLLAGVQALIGLAVLCPGYIRKIAIAAGIMLSLGFWAVGQGFGGYYSGIATDPNTGPLFVLLGAAVLAGKPADSNQFRKHQSKLLKGLENKLT
jgi:hypothetical protein